jgi:hypothetical protein
MNDAPKKLAPEITLRELPATNIRQISDCPDEGFSLFYLDLLDKTWHISLHQATTDTRQCLSNSLFAVILSFGSIIRELLTTSISSGVGMSDTAVCLIYIRL